MLDGLARAVDVVLGQVPGAARARQVRWVAGELDLAHDAGLLPGPLTHPHTPRAYLAAADAGDLRRRATATGPSPAATCRVRRQVLSLLLRAAGAGQAAAQLDALPAPPPGTGAGWSGMFTLRSATLAAAARPGAPHAAVRAGALIGLLTDTAARPAALAGLTVDDLHLRGRGGEPGLVELTETPPGSGRSHTRTAILSGSTTSVVTAWLARRAELVGTKSGVQAVFVSIAGNHNGAGAVRPAGLPLLPRGLARAYAVAVDHANATYAGTEGFPLPRTLTGLRTTAAQQRPRPATR